MAFGGPHPGHTFSEFRQPKFVDSIFNTVVWVVSTLVALVVSAARGWSRQESSSGIKHDVQKLVSHSYHQRHCSSLTKHWIESANDLANGDNSISTAECTRFTYTGHILHPGRLGSLNHQQNVASYDGFLGTAENANTIYQRDSCGSVF